MALDQHLSDYSTSKLLRSVLQNDNRLRIEKALIINSWKSGNGSNVSTQFRLKARYMEQY